MRENVLAQMRKSRSARWALRVLYAWVVLALLGDFIANERPLFCRVEGRVYFPILRGYLVDAGWAGWPAGLNARDWTQNRYDVVWMPLIPYSARTQDAANRGFVSPFAAQQVSGLRYRHWIGTDELGRDALAGLISGTRVAMLVGVIAMSVATLLGLFFGGLAGYFGDDRFQLSRVRVLCYGLGVVLGYFYGFMARSGSFGEQGFWGIFGVGLLIFSGVVLAFYLLAGALERIPWLGRKGAASMDLFIMRWIDIYLSIPRLLLLLAIVAMIQRPSVFYVMAIIGLLEWPVIARFFRAELLRVRQLEYIESARSMGYGEWRILLRHALPNAIGPVLVTISFGIAGAILAEAALSFLNLGVSEEEITWGKMLYFARKDISAWWLAVFPGAAIFITVTVFNILGDALSDAIKGK